ncbi:MAG: heat-inducible transcriptional repressor HrcA [Bacillota bacterium]
MTLDERKRKVLQALVEDYVATAAPVGSRTLARKYGLGVSPATIRNEMADLEEMGYLEQPHTSAGRIPTDLGYRFYVDSLMRIRGLDPYEIRRLCGVYERKFRQVEKVLQETVKALCDTTDYLALVLGPYIGRTSLRHVFLCPMGPGIAMLVLATDVGFVENRFLEVPEETTGEDLAYVARVLQTRLEGMDIARISSTAVVEIQSELSQYRTLLEHCLDMIRAALEPLEENRVWIGSTSKMMSLPEFRDVDRIRAIMRIIEQQELVMALMLNTGLGIKVSIGDENPVQEMRDCSLVTATYQVAGQVAGSVGLLGPKRMDYARAVAVVDVVEKALSEALGRVAGA